MNRRTIENMILVVVVLVVLGVFALAIHGRPIVDQVVVVRAADINCGVIVDIEQRLYANQGVVTVEVNPNDGRVIVGYDSKAILPQTIVSLIASMGYDIHTAETFDVDRFKAMTGRDPAATPVSIGCGGACGVRKS